MVASFFSGVIGFFMEHWKEIMLLAIILAACLFYYKWQLTEADKSKQKSDYEYIVKQKDETIATDIATITTLQGVNEKQQQAISSLQDMYAANQKLVESLLVKARKLQKINAELQGEIASINETLVLSEASVKVIRSLQSQINVVDTPPQGEKQ